MRTIQPYLLLGLLISTPVLHAAEPYRCVDSSGKLTLSDTPCNSLPLKPPPPVAGQAKPPETLTPPKPEPILPPPAQPLPSPPAPPPAAPPTQPVPVQPLAR